MKKLMSFAMIAAVALGVGAAPAVGPAEAATTLPNLPKMQTMSQLPKVEIACRARGPHCPRGFTWNGNRCVRC